MCRIQVQQDEQSALLAEGMKRKTAAGLEKVMPVWDRDQRHP
jgi:hypothetical protein